MYHLARTGADPVPLDFNTPSRTDRVADAPKQSASLLDDSHLPAFNTESLLAELGLPPHRVRVVLAESRSPDV